MYSFGIMSTTGERAMTFPLGADRAGMAKRKPIIMVERFNLGLNMKKRIFEVI